MTEPGNLPRPVDAAFRAPDDRTAWAEPSYSGALSFLRRRYARDAAGADAVVWGIPLDVATSYRPGARFGPQAIRRISAMLEPADPVWPQGIDPFERLAVVDAGDAVWDYGRPETIAAEIERQAAGLIAGGATLITLGGDHFATYPLLRAHAARHGPLALVQFDAHQDTWDGPGEKRIDHGSFVARALRDGLVMPERSIQIGVRTIAPTTGGIAIVDAEAVMRGGVDEAARRIRERVGAAKAYLTFDIDCLDPAFAPGTGTPVPGGLATREALAVLRGIAGLAFVGFDVMEVAPPYDHADITANAAAMIAQTFLVMLAHRS
jgi:agmatinase